MRLGEAHGTWSGVIRTDQHSLWSPRRARWSRPRGDEVGMTKWDLALGKDRDTQFDDHKSLFLLNFFFRILSFYLAHSTRSPTLECSPTTQFIVLLNDTSISSCLHLALGLSHRSS